MEVTLHIYDVTNTTNEQANAMIMRVNNLTRDLAVGGVFHGAVELNGKEWSFGYCDAGSGVYACLPKLNPQYSYRESIPMGVTALTLPQVNEVLQELRQDWAGASYDLLGRNCCHFCEVFCERLGVGPVPAWVNRFAYGAEATVNAIQTTYSQIQWLGSSIAGAWNSTMTAAAQFGGIEPAARSDEGVLRVGEPEASAARPSSSRPANKGASVGAVPLAAATRPATAAGVVSINSPVRAVAARGPERLTAARLASDEAITWSL